MDPRALLARRARLLEAAVRARRAHPRTAADEVALAWVLDDLGRADEAAATWAAALALEPAGPHAAAAHVALAEHAAARGDAAAALDHARAAVADPTYGGWATWRAAWCAWQLGRLDEAVEGFFAVAGGPDALLAEDARRDARRLAQELPAEDAARVFSWACVGVDGCAKDGP